jgi:hypothetical protein
VLVCLGSDFTRLSTLDDYNSDSDEEGPDHKLLCCGEQRPRKTKVNLEINAAGNFLTVHDFVSAVHPWLLQLRERILQAFEFQVDGTSDAPFNHDARFMVVLDGPDGVTVEEEEERWKGDFDRKRNLDAIQWITGWEKLKTLEYQQRAEEESWGYDADENLIQDADS